VFTSVALEFTRAEELDEAEIDKFETLTKDWFEGFFQARTGRRKLQTSVGLRNMKTNITITGQKFLEANAANGRPDNVNTITYNQTIEYFALENAQTPKEYIEMPFEDSGAKSQYRDSLAGNIDALRFIESVPTPVIQVDDPGGGGGGGGLGTGAIVGIALGALIVGAVVGFFVIKRRSARRPLQVHKEDRESSNLRPDAPHDSSFDPTNTTDDMQPDEESRSPNTTDDISADTDSQIAIAVEDILKHKDQGRSVPLAEARLLSRE